MPPCDLASPIQYVKGVGPSRASQLGRLNIHSVRDLIYYQPIRYEARPALCSIRDIKLDQWQVVCGKIVSAQLRQTISKNPYKGKRLDIFEAQLTDGSAWLQSVWFNQPYLKNTLKSGMRVLLKGQAKRGLSGPIPQMLNPEFEVLDEDETVSDDASKGAVVPIYGLTEGLTQRRLRAIISTVFNQCDLQITDPIPGHILKAHNLPTLREGIYRVHFPPEGLSVEELNSYSTPYQKRLIFDDLFFMQLGLCALKHRLTAQKGIVLKGNGAIRQRLLNNLPFALTRAQKRVIEEILRDMDSPRPMNRLVQGDVGCGKTIVALLSMLNAVECGYQAALMAPTELLAEQHYHNIKSLLGDMDLPISLVTGSRKDKGALTVTKSEAMLIVGTHALIQEAISFEALGLVVIDEQHRFGVLQRASLRKKGNNPDVLVMTATPIPRTLAMTLYGDLDYSVIDELPPGRTPVHTMLFFENRKHEIYKILEREILKGRQAYIVYPLIEESENSDLRSAIKGAEALPKAFPNLPGLRVGLIHGKMRQEERETVMREFKEGHIHILVATTVIEVGVDVPNASVMVIVHAERFGLAQLHQLRGRVGRGNSESYCLLLCYGFSEEAKRRLMAMVKTTDGFKIAEEDMKIRGYGDFFGTRQSGMPDLRFANLLRDGAMVELARQEALSLLKEDPMLTNYPLLRSMAQEFWGDKIDLFKTA